MGCSEPLPPALFVTDRREEMADARLVGDVEAVGAPWAAFAVATMVATRAVMANKSSTLAARPSGASTGCPREDRVR